MSLVEEDRHVVRVDPVDGEGEDARSDAGIRGAKKVDPGLALERGGHPGIDRELLRLDRVEPDAGKVVEARVGTDHARVVLQARFEAVGRGAKDVSFEGGAFDRLTAEEQRSKMRERLGRGREDPGPGGAEHLVGRDRIEVDPDPIELELLVRGRLATVEENERAVSMGAFRDLHDRQGVTVQVRRMEQAHEPNALREPLLERLPVEPSVIRKGQDLDSDPPLGGEPLPDDQVRVVLPVGDEHTVAGLPG